MDDTDPTLLARVRDGDAGAAATLFDRYGDTVYRYVRGCGADPEEAEDITQDVFVRVLTAGLGFRGAGSLAGWLLRIARHRLIDQARSERARRQRESNWALARADVHLGGADADDTTLHRALGALALEDREIIVLARFLDLPGPRVAEILEVTPGAARVRLHRALARLSELYHHEEAPREC